MIDLDQTHRMMTTALAELLEREVIRRMLSGENTNDMEAVSVDGCTCHGIRNLTKPPSDAYWAEWRLDLADGEPAEFTLSARRGTHCRHVEHRLGL